ncbi:uncharacterized protein ACR2FA_010721 [Aphomia sociella]
MFRFILIVVAICFLKDINAACYARYREPCTFKPSCPCAFSESISGVATCPNVCPKTGDSTFCSCGAPSCGCFKDTANVCDVCKTKAPPMCSCLANLDKGCDCGAMKSFIYFPEVDYPMTTMEMNPFFFSTCWFP